MNEQQRAVVQQALEALIYASSYCDTYPEIESLRQLLEQPATEDSSEVDHGDELTIAYLDGVHTGKRMAKREWVGLNYEEAKEIYTCIHGHDSEIRLCRAIEAKLKEKNT